MFAKGITGWHVLAMFGLAFGVVISVNVALAVNAIATFPGLETRNSYVASQVFNRQREAQLALGWSVSAKVMAETLILRIDDKDGPVQPEIVAATLGRATHVAQDQVPDFVHNGTAFVAPVGALGKGNWNLRLVARAPNGTEFRQRLVVATDQ